MRKHLIVLTLLVLLVTSQAVQAAGYNCLRLDNPPDDFTLLNWQTGTARKLSLPYNGENWGEQYAMITFSPDGHHAAYLRMDSAIQDGPPFLGALMIAAVNTLGELGPETVVHSGLVVPVLAADGWDRLSTSFYWSSDSQWLLYRWKDQPRLTDPPRQYAAIATPDGKTQRVITLPTVYIVSIDNTDTMSYTSGTLFGPYVVLTIAQFTPDQKPLSQSRIALLKIPDMAFRDVFAGDKTFANSLCLSAHSFTSCAAWSPDRRLIAIDRLDRDGKAYMVILDPSVSMPQAIFSIPTTGTAIWSPDGQYIALFSIVNPGDPNASSDTSRARIDIFGVDNGSHVVVTENAFIWRGGDAVTPDPSPPMQWCDSRHLEYLGRVTPDNDLIIQTADFSLSLGYVTSFSAPITVTMGASTEYDLTPQMVTPDCKSMFDLQQWTDSDGDHAGVENDTTQNKISLIDRGVTGMKWIGTTALARWHGGLAWMNADGTNRHEIVAGADVTPQHTSVDGQWLLFTGTPNIPADLYLANLKLGTDRLLLANATQWAFSPDDRYVLATNGKSAGTSLVALPDGRSQVIDLGSPAASETVYRMEWSPDGLEFAVFASGQGASTLDIFQPNGTPLRHFDHVPVFNTVSWPLVCDK